MHNPIILTGDRPTGKLHIGHYVGSLRQRVEAQHHYRQFVMIADLQPSGEQSAAALGAGHGFVHLDVTDEAGW